MRGNEHACLHEPAVCSTSSVRTAAPASDGAGWPGWCGPCSPDKEIGARKSVSGKKINNKNSIFKRYKIECQRVCIPPLRDEGRKGRKAMIVSAGS